MFVVFSRKQTVNINVARTRQKYGSAFFNIKFLNMWKQQEKAS
jgi:hypothetical protein